MTRPNITPGRGNLREDSRLGRYMISVRETDNYIPVILINSWIKPYAHYYNDNRINFSRVFRLEHKQEELAKIDVPFIKYFYPNYLLGMNFSSEYKEDIYSSITDTSRINSVVIGSINSFRAYTTSKKQEFPRANFSLLGNYKVMFDNFHSVDRGLFEINGFGNIYSGEGFIGAVNSDYDFTPIIVLYLNKKYKDYYQMCLLTGEEPDKRIFKVVIKKDLDTNNCPTELLKFRNAYRKYLKDSLSGIEKIESEEPIYDVFNAYRIVKEKSSLKQVKETINNLAEEALHHIKVVEGVKRYTSAEIRL